MSNIIIGDVGQGQKWWGVADHLKRQLQANHRQNNAYMVAWKQVSNDTKIFVKMVAGNPVAYIFTAPLGGYQFFVSEGDPNDGYFVAWAEIPMDDMELWDSMVPGDTSTYLKANLTPTTLESKFPRAALHPYQPTQCVNKWVSPSRVGFGAALPSYDAWNAALGDENNVWRTGIGVYDHAALSPPYEEHSQLDNSYSAYYQQQSIAEFGGAIITMSPIGLCGIKRDDGWHWYYTISSPLPNGRPASFYWKFSSDGSKVCGWAVDYASDSQNVIRHISWYVEHSFDFDNDGLVQVYSGTPVQTPYYWGSCVGVDYEYGTTNLLMLTLESPFHPSTEMSVHLVRSQTETVWKRHGQVCLSVKLIDVANATVIYTTQIGYEEPSYGRADGRSRRKKIAAVDLSQFLIVFGYEYTLIANDALSTRACYDAVNMLDNEVVFQQERPPGWDNWTPMFANRSTINPADYDSHTIETAGWTRTGPQDDWSEEFQWDGIHEFFIIRSNEGDVQPPAITQWLTPYNTQSYWIIYQTGSFAVFSTHHVRMDTYIDSIRQYLALYEGSLLMGVDLLVRIKGQQTDFFENFHRDVIGISTDRVVDIHGLNSRWTNSDHRSINPGYAAGLVFTKPPGVGV